MNLIKTPRPRNFRTGKVSLSFDEVNDLKNGSYDKLVIMKYGEDNEVLFTKDITQSMIESIEYKDDYCLMSYRA